MQAKIKTMRTKLTLLVFVFMMAGFGTAQGQTTLRVGKVDHPDAPFDHNDIASAILAAANDSGVDIILVYPGTYTETLHIDVSNLRIESKEGPEETIISPEFSSFSVVSIYEPGVHLEGFTIDSGFSEMPEGEGEGEGEGSLLGVWAIAGRLGGEGPTIKNNIIKNVLFGMYIDSFDESTIKGNEVESYFLGIEILGGAQHELSQNTFTIIEADFEGEEIEIPSQGIRLVFTSDNTIKENTVTGFDSGMVIDCDFFCFDISFLEEGPREAGRNHRNGEHGPGTVSPSRGNQISENRIEAEKYGMRIVLDEGDDSNGNPNEINFNRITGEEFNLQLIEPPIQELNLEGQSAWDLLDISCNWWGTAIFSEIAEKFVDLDGEPIEAILLVPFLIPSSSGEQFWPGGGNFVCEGGDIVRRKEDGKIFFTIQEAMDDEGTVDGDIIEVFGDTGEDNVNVYKQVEIRFYLRGSN